MITIEKEPEEFLPKFSSNNPFAIKERFYENCIFCDKPTPFWNMKTNRPVCESCAKTYNKNDIKSAPYNY